MPRNVDIRFAVGAAEKPHSSIWKLVGDKKGDVYLAVRDLMQYTKFSFHANAPAHSALSKEHAISENLSDRLLSSWKRPWVPARGTMGMGRLAWLAFPSDYLSTERISAKKRVSWIPAAPAGDATFVEVALTAEEETTVDKTLHNRGVFQLVNAPLLGDERLIAFAYYGQWQNRDITIPAKFDKPEYFFSANDPRGTARPRRMTFHVPPKDEDALVITELGGYPTVL